MIEERTMLKQEIAIGSTKRPSHIRARVPDFRQTALADVFSMIGAPLNIERNAEIYGEGEPAEYVYCVTRGVVRTYKLLSDGRRQISAFLLPGDVFGLEDAVEHRFTAEAVCESAVVFVKRSALVEAAMRNGEVSSDLWMLASADLRRAHDHMLLLGRKSAQERIAAFLMEMADRADQTDMVELPMSRLDIADYLGLTIETVSRTLTLLESASTIELPSTRRIRLCNKAALSRLNA
jgi:CRP/FNR family transcriptional regulator, nitrogen fixation regulation protein